MRNSKGCPEREDQSITGLPKEDRKISNEQPKLTHKRTRKITNKVQSE